MIVTEAAHRYAKVLFEELKSSKEHESVLSELRALLPAFASDPKTTEFFASPLVSPEDKSKTAQSACQGKLSPVVLSVVMLMAEKGRIPLFDQFVQAFEQLADQEHGVTRGVVRSAKAVSKEALASLEQTVAKVTGKKVIFTFQEDQSLLGGMVAEVGGWRFDDSLSSHLKRMNEELNRRSN